MIVHHLNRMLRMAVIPSFRVLDIQVIHFFLKHFDVVFMGYIEFNSFYKMSVTHI